MYIYIYMYVFSVFFSLSQNVAMVNICDNHERKSKSHKVVINDKTMRIIVHHTDSSKNF